MIKPIIKMQLLALLMLVANAKADEVNIQDGQRSFIYTDPANNLAWTSALPGWYTNGCEDANGDYNPIKCSSYDISADGSRHVKVDDSNAAKACRDLRDNAGNLMGARLPTQEEYQSLIRSMGQVDVAFVNDASLSSDPHLTVLGAARMQEIFGDYAMSVGWKSFWTSTLLSYKPEIAITISSGTVGLTYRGSAHKVRCVSGS